MGTGRIKKWFLLSKSGIVTLGTTTETQQQNHVQRK